MENGSSGIDFHFLTGDNICMIEIWKPCPSYPSAQASSLGNIRTLEKRDCRGRLWPSKIPKQTASSEVYVSVSICRKNIPVQWLVADAFLGPRPDGMDVCHKNDIGTDNRACNLEYGSRSNNLMQRWENGTSLGRSKYLGVCFSKREGKWKSYYDGGRPRIWLGTFQSEQEAARAVDEYVTDHNLQRRLNLCIS